MDKNIVNFNNMQVINLNDINCMQLYNKIEKEKKEKEEKEKKEKETKKEEIEKKAEEEIKEKEENEKKEDKGEKEENEDKEEKELTILIDKFRFAFQLDKKQFSDNYLRNLLLKSDKDFRKAFVLHLDTENLKKEKNKENTKDININDEN